VSDAKKGSPREFRKNITPERSKKIRRGKALVGKGHAKITSKGWKGGTLIRRQHELPFEGGRAVGDVIGLILSRTVPGLTITS